jgi:hypothetical protein
MTHKDQLAKEGNRPHLKPTTFSKNPHSPLTPKLGKVVQ